MFESKIGMEGKLAGATSWSFLILMESVDILFVWTYLGLKDV